MRVECQTCNTRFKLDDSLIKKDGTKVRCSKCKEIITVYPEDEKTAPSTKSLSKPGSPAKKKALIHEAETPKNTEHVDIDTAAKPKKTSTRVMILISILILTITGATSFYFNYLHIFAVTLISFIFFGT
ncbi:MscS mechanosensitive ion channel, partial [Candidatus Magnetomorum sp. HK-1]